MDRDRLNRAQTTLSANKSRHKDIQDIEKEMIVLAQLFQDMEALVIQQDTAIQNIEQQGERVVENVEGANVHIEGAITSARGARKKKFICLGIASKFSHLRISHTPAHLS
jgi:syntaxin 1B/2/3